MTTSATASLDVVALGARTAIGMSAESAAAAARAGICRLGEHPFIVDSQGDMARMALVPQIDPQLLGGARILALAQGVLEEVMPKLPTGIASSGAVFVALPEARPGLAEAEAQQIADELAKSETLRGFRVSLAGRGHAGAFQALRMAAEGVADRQVEVCVVVGADSYAEPETLEWLDANGQLLREGIRSGLVPGEAAGAMVVAAPGVRKSLRLPCLARVRTVSTSFESNLIKTDDEITGVGLSGAIAGATAPLRMPDEAIDAVYCDINGERYRTDEWAFSVLRLGAVFRKTQYEAPSSLWGDVGAASGVLGCVLAARSWARAYAAGPRALVWGGSEAGLRGAAVLETMRS